MMRHSGMREFSANLGKVGTSRLRGWGPKDPSTRWIETVNDRATNHEVANVQSISVESER